ncbi:MAG: RNA-binding protein [Alphaproteobacteria bacterium]|nr:RNA-binding protein [Alphaproteobacteria bacterium]
MTFATDARVDRQRGRAGRHDAERHDPERRCIASGAVGDRDALIRFVVGPGATLVPDLAERLPGRGLWVKADQAMLRRAVERHLFARAAKASIRVPDDLLTRVEKGLADSCLGLMGMARRAGQAVAGFERVRAAKARGQVALLIEASDGAPVARRGIAGGRSAIAAIDLFTAAELGAVFGMSHAVHVGVAPGRLAKRLAAEAGRLWGVRGGVGARSGISKA